MRGFGHFTRRLALAALAGLLFVVGASPGRSQRSSQNTPALEKALKRFPKADTNGDGVLTFEEARAFQQQLQAGAGGEQGAAIDELLAAAPPALAKAAAKAGAATKLSGPEPTFANVSYGPHPSNVLDFWKAPSDTPTPLVVFIHGGGFTSGSKDKVRQGADVISPRLRDGVSFATIEYRFRKDAPIQDILRDCARAIQFLRYKSKDWNIDKTRVAAYGGSAGAGTSLWLAFHDDLADPKSADPVLRESSRLTVAGANATQFSYDLLKWEDLLGPYPGERDEGEEWEFYHFKSKDDLETAEGQRIRADVDMIGLMSKDDAPFFAGNMQTGGPSQNRGQYLHHPLHATALEKRAKEIGLECAVFVKDTPVPGGQQANQFMWTFFYKHLGVQPKAGG